MDDDRLTCVGLASKGHGGGDPDQVEEMAVQAVLDLASFALFEKQYEETKFVMKKPEGR